MPSPPSPRARLCNGHDTGHTRGAGSSDQEVKTFLSLFDRISYTILKRCPSLRPTLDLFNRVVMEGQVGPPQPGRWQLTSSSPRVPPRRIHHHQETPARLRLLRLSVALGNSEGQMVKAHACQQQYMYLNPDLQKAFLLTVPGVAEHQATAIISTRHCKRSLAIARLDIANVFTTP